MSRTLSAPRWGLSAALAGILALTTTALLAIGLMSQANAAFSIGKCAGADTSGRGASFARDAHTWFNQNFRVNYCAGTPGAGVLDMAYDAAGSGAGRLSMKVRNDAPRFGMTDEPPSTTDVAQMNAGTGNNPPASDANPNDNGQIHVVPAAVGAVAPLVNFPNGCEAADLPAASKTSTDPALIRVRFTKAQFEEIWAQGETGATPTPYLTWKTVFPALDAVPACEKPIIRVVRFDDSGTTFTFKDYLDTIDPAEGWLTTYGPGSGAKTRTWPGAEFGGGGQCGATEAPGKKPDNEDHLTSGCANGNAFLVQTLKATDGSVGYSDISTARSEGLAVNPAGGDVDQFWTQIENGSGEFTEPTKNPNGFRTDGQKGANCEKTTFTDVPATTLGNWESASGVNSAEGFGICTLTYGLVFNDNAAVWGNTPAEEAKARTVKDYWLSVLSSGSQNGLLGADYSPLPAGILAIAKAGIEGIIWAGTAGEPSEIDDPIIDTKGGNPLPPAKPSNAFSLLRKSISSKTGGATVSVKLPGAGTLEVIGTAKKGKKTIKVGRTVLKANQAGTFNLVFKPSAAAMKILKEKGKLPVKLELVFTPTGGDENDSSSSLTLKLTKKGK